jgi:hypothetical protein
MRPADGQVDEILLGSTHIGVMQPQLHRGRVPAGEMAILDPQIESQPGWIEPFRGNT